MKTNKVSDMVQKRFIGRYSKYFSKLKKNLIGGVTMLYVGVVSPTVDLIF